MTDYKPYSSSELIEEIKNSEQFSLELVQECFNRQHSLIYKTLEMKARENDQLKELIRSVQDFPLKGSILYFPNQDRYEFVNISEIASVYVPEKLKVKYRSLDDSNDFYLKLTVDQISGSMFHYVLYEKTEEEKKFVMNSHVGNAVTLALAISASVMFFNGNMDKMEAKASISHELNVSAPEKFMTSYEVVISDLRKNGYKLNPENDLKDSDVKLITSMMKEDEEEPNHTFDIMSEHETISSIEQVISPYMKDKKNLDKIAHSIFEASKDRKVDYLLFLSIMKVETNTFNQDAVSSSGDLSIAQIKPEVWQDEFERLGKEPLDVTRLKKDPSYAIDRMGEILEIQNKYKDKDPYWYARYHSKTPSRKLKYAKKVQQEYLRMKEVQVAEVETKISNLIAELNKIQNAEFDMSLSYAKHVLSNKEKIESHLKELKKIQALIGENKNKKMKELVAQL